jgi:SAM-dependent methyltransferase
MTVGASGDDPWNENENPRRYDAFARQYPIYRQTSQDLVALARPSGGATVIDLACGTGVTTEAILAALGANGRVIGVDGSAAMLAMAASSITDGRVSWIHARAENLGQHVTGPVDAVVCNSAIWQTDLAPTMTAVRNVLAAGGRFVFNFGYRHLERDEPPARGPKPSLSAVMQAIAELDYNWTPPPPEAPAPRRRPSRESVCQLLNQAGFEVDQVAELEYEESPDALRAWLSVPIFTERPLRGLPYGDRMAILDQACQRLGAGEPTVSRWVAFAARASGKPAQPARLRPERRVEDRVRADHRE